MRVNAWLGCSFLAVMFFSAASAVAATEVYEVHGYVAAGEVQGQPPTDVGADFTAILEIDRTHSGYGSSTKSTFSSPVRSFTVEVWYGEDISKYVFDPNSGSYVDV